MVVIFFFFGTGKYQKLTLRDAYVHQGLQRVGLFSFDGNSQILRDRLYRPVSVEYVMFDMVFRF
jgi:hypothetical protein